MNRQFDRKTTEYLVNRPSDANHMPIARSD
jgi:hypothetical protein